MLTAMACGLDSTDDSIATPCSVKATVRCAGRHVLLSLGGCSFAAGASGNVATEDVAYLLAGLDIDIGVNLPGLASTGAWISAKLGRQSASRPAKALLAKDDRH